MLQVLFQLKLLLNDSTYINKQKVEFLRDQKRNEILYETTWK